MDETPDGRRVATEVLFRVVQDDAYASVVLDRALRDAKLDPRDSALATQICYGALRVLPGIDAAIRKALHRPERPVEAWTMAALRAATFQLLHMRTPARAVVHSTVRLIKQKRGPKLGAFANGVLRKVAGERPESPSLPTYIMLPAWLENALRSYLPPAEFEAFTTRSLPPPTGVLTFLDADCETLYSELQKRGASALSRFEFPPHSLTLQEGGDLRSLPSSIRKRMRVMELGSQIVAASVPLDAGMTVADCCAGRGGKSLLLASRLGREGHVRALELHARKLQELEKQIEFLADDVRARLAPISTLHVDLSVGSAGLDAMFDVVFVDLPCSGTGTVHRRPELLLRLTEERVKALCDLQERIALNCARLVRPGGLLVVAVCSLLPAEGLELKRRILARAPELEPHLDACFERLAAPIEGVYRTGPWQQNADGFQLFALRRPT